MSDLVVYQRTKKVAAAGWYMGKMSFTVVEGKKRVILKFIPVEGVICVTSNSLFQKLIKGGVIGKISTAVENNKTVLTVPITFAEPILKPGRLVRPVASLIALRLLESYAGKFICACGHFHSYGLQRHCDSEYCNCSYYWYNPKQKQS